MSFLLRLRQRARVLRWEWHLRALYAAAYVWRILLFRTTFVAVTGSVGKTTTKECLAAILSSRFATAKSLRNQNDRYGVPRSILRVRPWHRFAVMEVATGTPGQIGRSGRLLRPHIGVVLTVARTHTNAFRSLDETAAEKASLLDWLPHNGLAILNAEDSRVRRMADKRRCNVKLFGRSPGLALWADQISSKWPERLSFNVHMGSETQIVRTKLVGEHWVSSAAAALLTAHSCGVESVDAVEALGRVEPFPARLQPAPVPSGATMLRDEVSGDPDSFDAALQVMKNCRTARRIVVFGDLSDVGSKKPRDRFKELGRVASQTAEMAVFVGAHASHGAAAAIAAGMKPEAVTAFVQARAAAEHLRGNLRRGDLALLRGRTTEHLSRLYFAQFGSIGCWKSDCRKTITCDFCPELRCDFARSESVV